MVQRKLLQIVTVIFHIFLLSALFVPAVQDYDMTISLWSKIWETMLAGNQAYILIYSIYYVPVITSSILITLLESRIKYALGLIAATLGLSLSLSMFIFPAMSSTYLFSVYKFGIYITLCLQLSIIVLCCIGICINNLSQAEENPIDTKSFTEELPINEIISGLQK